MNYREQTVLDGFAGLTFLSINNIQQRHAYIRILSRQLSARFAFLIKRLTLIVINNTRGSSLTTRAENPGEINSKNDYIYMSTGDKDFQGVCYVTFLYFILSEAS